MAILSTECVPARDRFEYWYDMVSSTFVTLKPPPEKNRRAPFNGRLEARQLGSATIVQVQADEHAVGCGRSSSEGFFFVGFHGGGTARYAQDGRECVAQDGDIVLLDSSRPFNIHFDNKFCMTTAKLPGATLSPRLLNAKRATAIRISRSAGVQQFLLDYVSAVTKNIGQADAVLAETLCESLCEAVGSAVNHAMGGDGFKRRSGRTLMLDAMRRHIACNLGDPALSPAAAAEHFGVSLRYVHKVFELSGTTFNQLVLDCRLARCREELMRASGRYRFVSEIAFAWGFNDLSYFHRTFRRRYGTTPGECRNSSSSPGVNRD